MADEFAQLTANRDEAEGWFMQYDVGSFDLETREQKFREKYEQQLVKECDPTFRLKITFVLILAALCFGASPAMAQQQIGHVIGSYSAAEAPVLMRAFTTFGSATQSIRLCRPGRILRGGGRS
jgi:hypothetical protein